MSNLTDRFKWLVATCCGFGHAPIMPGTAGALWGIVIYVPIALYAAEPYQSLLIALALVLTSAATVGLGRWAETFFGEKDSGKFVTDEVAGFLLTVLLFRTPDILVTVLWAFPVTRVIDIIKVPPARQLERIPGGWGVLLDDLLGSLYAAFILHATCHLLPHWIT